MSAALPDRGEGTPPSDGGGDSSPIRSRRLLADALRRLPAFLTWRLRLWLLFIASGLLFLVAIFVAIPSATIEVWPRESNINQTANVLLAASGADVTAGPLIAPLFPVVVSVQQSLSFDQVSRKFTGVNATVPLAIINESREPYSLRPGTRFQNQAGVFVRLREAVDVPPATPVAPGTAEVQAVADPEDLYGQVVGERGNVPAGLKWEAPGLPPEERGTLYARNPRGGEGGVTAFTRVLRQDDLVLAEKVLRQHLLDAAEVLVEEHVALQRQRTGHDIVVLPFDALRRTELSDVVLPVQFLGHEVSSAPVEGRLTLTVLAYDKTAILDLLSRDLRDHVERDKILVEESLREEGLSVHVISYDDNLTWVKVTAELTARERYDLSPVTHAGIAFAQRVRDGVRGMSRRDATHVIQNFAEVGKVRIRFWPPWQKRLPELPTHIVVEPQ